MRIIESLKIYFNIVNDERHGAYVTYELPDILFLLVCGLLCGCTSIERILGFGEEKIDFFRKHSKLEGIPCIKTINNILRIIKPNKLENMQFQF